MRWWRRPIGRWPRTHERKEWENVADTYALMVHPARKDARLAAEKMADGLCRAGIQVIYPQTGGQTEKCRMVLTFGGDGTLLAGARVAIRHDCPLLGINLGTLGFLTEGEPEQIEKTIRALEENRYTLESRGLLSVQVNEETEKHLALNDAVVIRGGFARMIQVETWINQEHWSTFIADGVIAATPTGSTGYSLSAGGPVIAPGVDCMAVTPVCAHSLQHCPCIVPTNAEILFRLRKSRDQLAELQIDGQSVRTLAAGDSVRVTGAKKTLQLVRLEEYRFFSVLEKKLNEWSSPREDRQG